jgi:hypothetical protein
MAIDLSTISPAVKEWFTLGKKNRAITAGEVTRRKLSANPEVQQFMSDLGLLNPRTGLGDTKKIKEFQLALGFNPPDGKFGPLTFAAMMGGGVQPTPQPGQQPGQQPDQRRPADPGAITRLQQDFPGIQSATADAPPTAAAQRIQSDFPGIQPTT